MGALKPWEGGLVILDGSGRDEFSNSDGGGWILANTRENSANFVEGGNEGGAVGGKDENSNEDVEALKQENAKLKEQAERAMALAQQWGAQNAKLQQELLLKGGGR